MALLLMSANWLIGLGVAAAMLAHVEEAALIDTFGNACRVYMRRTRRFLPRLGVTAG